MPPQPPGRMFHRSSTHGTVFVASALLHLPKTLFCTACLSWTETRALLRYDSLELAGIVAVSCICLFREFLQSNCPTHFVIFTIQPCARKRCLAECCRLYDPYLLGLATLSTIRSSLNLLYLLTLTPRQNSGFSNSTFFARDGCV